MSLGVAVEVGKGVFVRVPVMVVVDGRVGVKVGRTVWEWVVVMV